MIDPTLQRYFSDSSIPEEKRRAAAEKFKSGAISESQLLDVVKQGYSKKGAALGAATAGGMRPTGFAGALQEEADIGVGLIERPLRVAGRAVEGIGEAAAGLGQAAYYSSGLGMINPWEEKSAFEQSEAGLRGLTRAVQGVGTTLAAPIAASPLAEEALSKVGEVIQGGIVSGLEARGIDPESQRGQDIINSTMGAIDLAAIAVPGAIKGVKSKGVKGFVKEGVETVKKVPDLIEDIPRVVAAAGEGVVAKGKAAVQSVRPAQKARIINRNLDELTDFQSKKASVRKLIESAEKQGIDVKQKLAETDLLVDAVDKDGTIRAKGAIDQLNSELKPFEGIVGQLLEKEGASLSLIDVKQSLTDAINRSGLKGATKTKALRQIEREIEGLALDATDGSLPLSTLHEAKIDLYSNLDYTNPKSKAIDKLFAKEYKGLVEKISEAADIQKVNRQLSEWYSVRDLLDKMNGGKVKKGRLGKYFGGTVGAIVGSHLGPLGAIAGSEIGQALTGAQMAKTFSKRSGGDVVMGESLRTARETLKEMTPKKPKPVELDIKAEEAPVIKNR